ncbi:TetR/AcrR family transcriptional regulator [Paraconexibacter sp.]|uniref:TetR/AcrR family transcriptional regulator n=1 Tax=Paraconexibacter sp. TaxID=2949640 RepID=UPI0035620CFD
MSSRSYVQSTRAEATARTRRAILDAVQGAFDDGDLRLSLDEIAGRAGTTTRTILRHFGSRDDLIAAAVSDAGQQVMAQRSVPVGDVAAAVRRLAEHYEERGPQVLRMLAEAERNPLVRQVTDAGTLLHLEWVQDVFAPFLDDPDPEVVRERAARLATVTDLQTWALLRLRHGLSPEATEAAIRRLVDPITGERS